MELKLKGKRNITWGDKISKTMKEKGISPKNRFEKKSKEHKKKISESMKNKIPPNKGKGIPHITKSGYVIYWKNNKEIKFHREIWEKHNGKISKGYEIHHKDRNKSNNNINNLELVTKSEHAKLHYKERRKNGFGVKK